MSTETMAAREMEEVIFTKWIDEEDFREQPDRTDYGFVALQPRTETETACTSCWILTPAHRMDPTTGTCTDCGGDTGHYTQTLEAPSTEKQGR